MDSNKAFVAQVTRISREVAEKCDSKAIVDKALAAKQGSDSGAAPTTRDGSCPGDVSTDNCDDAEDVASRPHLYQLLQQMRATSMSTEFSGIDTPATAFIMLGTAICKQLGMDSSHVPTPANVYAVEWSAQAREELLHHPHCPQHVFGDINEFWRPHVASQLDALISNEHATDQVLLPLMRRGEATVRTAWCFKHGKMCTVDRAADLHAAGTPCTDWSMRGLMQKANGSTWKSFLCWTARRWDFQEPVVLQENVQGFDAGVLNHYLGEIYFVSIAVIDPNSLGMPIARPRQYCVLRHRWKTGAAMAPVNVFAEMFKAPVLFGDYSEDGGCGNRSP